MPTVGWIQETAIDNFYERGAVSDVVSLKPVTYNCRHCGKEFATKEQRDWHEVEHPIANPTLVIDGCEVLSTTFKVTGEIQLEKIEVAFVKRIVVNNKEVPDLNKLRELIGSATQQFFDIQLYGNETKKDVTVDVQIAEPSDLAKVDEEFSRCFCDMDFGSDAITRFVKQTEGLRGCDWYRDGLVRYIQGILAKDHRADLLQFGDFSSRLNQSYSLLAVYKTPLALSLCQMIRFIMNDFRIINKKSFIPALDTALRFFNRMEVSSTAIEQHKQYQLPIDYTSELILNRFVSYYSDFRFEAVVKEIKSMNRSMLSRQDKQKLDYLCFRKAEDEANSEMIKHYARRIKNLTEFSEQFRNEIGS